MTRLISFQVIRISVNLTTSHLGHFEFRLCANKQSPFELVTQRCLDRNVLRLPDGSFRYHVNQQVGLHNVVVKLPDNVVCDYCVIQWHYRTGRRKRQRSPCFTKFISMVLYILTSLIRRKYLGKVRWWYVCWWMRPAGIIPELCGCVNQASIEFCYCFDQYRVCLVYVIEYNIRSLVGMHDSVLKRNDHHVSLKFKAQFKRKGQHFSYYVLTVRINDRQRFRSQARHPKIFVVKNYIRSI